MKILDIQKYKLVKKTNKEMVAELSQFERQELACVDKYKRVEAKEPVFIVEMTANEIQLVNFYLELENRKPIMNVELKAEIKKEN